MSQFPVLASAKINKRLLQIDASSLLNFFCIIKARATNWSFTAGFPQSGCRGTLGCLDGSRGVPQNNLITFGIHQYRFSKLNHLDPLCSVKDLICTVLD